MHDILTQIVFHKRREVSDCKKRVPLGKLKQQAAYHRVTFSLQKALLAGSGVIAEFKRASPSKGSIKENADTGKIVRSYREAGAAAISVLTDRHFFGAADNDLPAAREAVALPVLRKEFIIDPYQIYEAKALGADAILLIAAILSPAEIRDFQHLATDLGLEVLVEVHHAEELTKLTGEEQLIGVNNRNLETFTVDIATSLNLAGQLGGVVRVTESGLGPGTNLQALKTAGYQGFLVGESLMKATDPGLACKLFIDRLKQLQP